MAVLLARRASDSFVGSFLLVLSGWLAFGLAFYLYARFVEIAAPIGGGFATLAVWCVFGPLVEVYAVLGLFGYALGGAWSFVLALAQAVSAAI